MKINNLFRWTGSKRKLLDSMLEVFDDTDVYIEPFLGSGIVLLRVLLKKQYKEIYVNDINKNVIDFYILLRDEGEELVNEIKKRKRKYDKLDTLEEKEAFFYNIRNKFNRDKYRENHRGNIIKTVDFWFLMQAGYNGVYRVNSKGHFNVPFGKKEYLIFSEDSFLSSIKALKNTKVYFYNKDYNEFLDELEQKDILKKAYLYCDPPYLPDTKSMDSSKALYTSSGFDHKDFAKKIIELSEKYNFNYSISATENNSSNEIYNEKYFTKQSISEIIRSVNPKRKLKVKEVLFRRKN